MKTQKIRPQLAAPVKRETVATVSRDGNALSPLLLPLPPVPFVLPPFAGDDVE